MKLMEEPNDGKRERERETGKLYLIIPLIISYRA